MLREVTTTGIAPGQSFFANIAPKVKTTATVQKVKSEVTEPQNKEKGFQIMLTRDVAREAGWEPSTEFTMTVDVRGVGEPVEVIGIPRGRDLASK